MMISNKTVTRFQRYILLLIIAMSVSSCGFQLRGALELSDEVSPLYLQQNSAFDLGREIRQLLASNKIELTNRVSKSNSQLTLLDEIKNRRVLSVDTDGRVREYLLIYTVKFSIQFDGSSDQQEDTIMETISLKRSLLFNQDAVLANTNESVVLYTEMRRDIARLILLKLQAHSKNIESGNSPQTEDELSVEPATQ